jgi:hypothetical protein
VNIHYIRAAILARTGIELSLDEVKRYLTEEGLLSKSKAKNVIFPGYSHLHDGVPISPKAEVIPSVDRIIKDD